MRRPTRLIRAAPAALVLLLAVSPASAETPRVTFGAATSTDLGTINPAGQVVGDFNQDGHLDLLVTSSNPRLFLGDGTGTLSPAGGFFFTQATAVAAADFNGDGYLDVVVTQDLAAKGSVYGDVCGSLLGIALVLGPDMSPARCLATGPRAIAVQTGEFNGDGWPDIAVASASGGGLRIYSGHYFDFPYTVNVTSVPGGDIAATSMARPTDLNGDGKLDLLVGYSGGVRSFVGNGDGTFTVPAGGSAASGPTQAVAVGDLNGDNRPDVTWIESGPNGRVLVGSGAGNGTFSTQVLATIGTDLTDVAIADIDRDGHADIVVARGGDGTIRLFFGNGDGTFVANPPLALTPKPKLLAVADWDEDGDKDLGIVDTRIGGANSLVWMARQGGSGPVDLTPPVVALTSPAAGSSVSGAVAATATASDNVGVTRVEFFADGNLVGKSAGPNPYRASWNSAALPNGPVTLMARAFDGAQNASDSVTIQVTVENQNVPPSVTLQPSAQTVCAGSPATFTGAASGSPTPTVRWQVSTDGGASFNDIPGATSGTLSFTAAANQTGNQYRGVFTSAAGTAISKGAALTVDLAPVITTSATDQTVSSGQVVTFTAAASGDPVPIVQWQVRTPGGATFTDIPGARSRTLSFTTSGSDSGNHYRAEFTNSCGTATTTEATLSISAQVQFSAANYTVSETAGKAVITVRRTGGTTGTATVDWTTSDGTAASGVKYSAVSGTLTFDPGVVNRTFAIPIINETAVEGDETVLLGLGNPTGAAYLSIPSTAVLTIKDDDRVVIALPEAVEFTAANYSVSQTAGKATITVKRQGPATSTVGVTCATSPGTAVPGVNYTEVPPTTLAFGPRVTRRTFAVPVINDSIHEGSRTVLLSLTDPTGGTALGTPSTALLTILDKDVAGVLQFSAPAYMVREGAGQARITVIRNGRASGVTVRYRTSGGSAVAGTDYTSTSGVLSFGAGVTSRSFTVPIADNGPKGDQTVSLELTDPTGGASLGAHSAAVLTIQTGQTEFQFSASSFTVSEIGHRATITVRRTGPTASDGTVDYATSDGSATAARGDYTPTAGTLGFGPGVASKIFTVPISDDALLEGNETVNLALSNPTGGAFLGVQLAAVLTIVTDDPSVQFGRESYRVKETTGKAMVTVIRKPPTKPVVTVDYATTSGGTAVPGADYTPTAGTLTFASGVVSKAFTVPILHDTARQGERTVDLAVSSPGGAILGTPSTALLVIGDFDVAGTLQFSVSDYSVSEAGPLATISVTRTGGSASDVAVHYAVSDGTAAAGTNYVATSGTLTFGYQQTIQSFTIQVLDDGVSTRNLTVHLALTNPQGGATVGGQSGATLWIVEKR